MYPKGRHRIAIGALIGSLCLRLKGAPVANLELSGWQVIPYNNYLLIIGLRSKYL